MTELSYLMKTILDTYQDARREYHLTLGRLIDKLEKLDPWMLVDFDWNGRAPTAPNSYRGYYSDLAFGWVSANDPFAFTVEKLLRHCRNALTYPFSGYKGGEYLMDKDTPLWVAQWGETGRAIVGLEVTDGMVILKTMPRPGDEIGGG